MAIADDPQDEPDFITLNVSGAVFEIRDALLKEFPDTLLGSPTKRLKYYDSYREQYFFDRHRQAFEAILFFYQSGGRINCPENVPRKVFADEIKYFEIPEEAQMYETVILGSKMGFEHLHPCQRKLWEIFEFPKSSTTAKRLGIFSQVIILVSLVTSCLRTLGYFQELLDKQFNNSTADIEATGSSSQRSFYTKSFWFSFDVVCYGWFTLEYAVRFFSSPRKCVCFQTWVGIIDLLTIVFFYILLMVKIAFPSAGTVVNLLEILCVVRVFKLLRYSKNFQILVSTFISGINDLKHLLIFAFVFMVLSSSAIFYAELDHSKSVFTSVPSAFWWSIITFTTIGYGDMVPFTVWGKVIAGFSALFGILMIALPLFRFAAKLRTFLTSIEERSNQ